MPQSILDIILRTKKEGNGVQQTNKELGELKKGLGGAIENMTGLSIGSLSIAGAIAGVGLAARKCLDDFVGYAEQVRAVQQASGLSAEESSKLVQVMDDLKVESGDLQTAMRFMAKNGIDPSIDSLAKLSDEYLTLAPGQERENFLVKEFGKNGLKMAEAMEQGGEALKKMADEQRGGLILTQDQIKAARDFEKSQDALNDSFEAIKVTLGSKLAPVATGFLTFLNNALTAGERLRQANLEGSSSYEDYIAKVKETAVATGNLTQAQAGELAAQQALSRGEYEARTAKETYSDSFERETMVAGNATKALETHGAAVDTEKQKTDLLNASMGELTDKIIFQAAAEGMSADQKLRLAQTMGLVDERSYEYMSAVNALKGMMQDGKITVEEYNQRVAALADSYDRLHDVDVTITTNFVETHTKKTMTGNQSNAAGGSFTIPAGFENEKYWFPGTNQTASSGETVIIKPAGGTGRAGASFNGMVVNINTPMDLETFKSLLVKATR